MMTQQEALDILKTGANALLTGEPGSGKTYTVNAYVKWLRAHGIEPAITASTGIAATHLGGMTIHAWSGIGIRKYLSDADADAIASKEHVARRLGKTQVLIIDEVSMLSGDVLSMVDRVLREVRGHERAFGGVQVVLVGDFFQLPPISGRGEDTRFAFESDAFRALNPLPLYLSEQYRSGDQSLDRVLANIRNGSADHSDISVLMTREAEEADITDDVPRLFTHNADVDRINEEKLRALPGSAKSYRMDGSGAPVLIESLKRGCLSPETLSLKQDAVVMFTKNNPIAGYMNGTLGVVTSFEFGTNYPVVETRDGRQITVSPQEWAVEEGGKIRAKISQLPLRLAWAITIHKSQGQSLDAAAIDLSKAFEYGQGYVALSRLRSLDGLHLLGWHEHALQIHPTVRARDEEFRAASKEAAAAFRELTEAGDRKKMEENFIKAVGGSLEELFGEKPMKKSTFEETLELLQEGKSLEEIRESRNVTLGTIITHLEKLKEGGHISEEEIRAMAPEHILSGLDEIEEAFNKTSIKSLTPAWKRLNGKYTFDDLKLARAILS
jgi:ATP-dependent exoDNAse (exonuclease V) alpha subunit